MFMSSSKNQFTLLQQNSVTDVSQWFPSAMLELTRMSSSMTFLMSFYCWQEEITVSAKQNFGSAKVEKGKTYQRRGKEERTEQKVPFPSLTICQAQLIPAKCSLGMKTHTYVFGRKVHPFPQISQQLTNPIGR